MGTMCLLLPRRLWGSNSVPQVPLPTDPSKSFLPRFLSKNVNLYPKNTNANRAKERVLKMSHVCSSECDTLITWSKRQVCRTFCVIFYLTAEPWTNDPKVLTAKVLFTCRPISGNVDILFSIKIGNTQWRYSSDYLMAIDSGSIDLTSIDLNCKYTSVTPPSLKVWIS